MQEHDVEKHHRDAELLIIGLGPSGSAALEAARSVGALAIGLEPNPAPPNGGIVGCEYDARVWGVFSEGTVAITTAEQTTCRAPGAIIIATGAIDIPLPVPGWRLPGAMGAAHAARSLADGTGVVVLRGPHARRDDRAPDLNGFKVIHDEDLSDGRPVVIVGTDAVSGVRIGGSLVATAHVLLDNGLQTENTLARMAGIPTTFSSSSGGDVIVPGRVFAVGGTLISVVGDAAGIGDERHTMVRDAAETAKTLAQAIKGGDIPRSIPSVQRDWDETGIPILPSQTTPETLVCPDEGVSIADIIDAIELGATTVNDVKWRTRAAMAECQGRDCLWTIRALLAAHHRSHATPMTARPPATGIVLRDMAALARH
ncbi:NAD(P)/FAD-dependent oxidoreductase [soil metagenome]